MLYFEVQLSTAIFSKSLFIVAFKLYDWPFPLLVTQQHPVADCAVVIYAIDSFFLNNSISDLIIISDAISKQFSFA